MSRRGQSCEEVTERLWNWNETQSFGQVPEHRSGEYSARRARPLELRRTYSEEIKQRKSKFRRVDETREAFNSRMEINNANHLYASNLPLSRIPPHSQVKSTHLQSGCSMPTTGSTMVETDASRRSMASSLSSMPSTGSTMVEMEASRRSVVSSSSYSSPKSEMSRLREDQLERTRERNRKIKILLEKIEVSKALDAKLASRARKEYQRLHNDSQTRQFNWPEEMQNEKQQRISAMRKQTNGGDGLSDAGISLGAHAKRYYIGQAIPTTPSQPQTRPRSDVAIEPMSMIPWNQATVAEESHLSQEIPMNIRPPKFEAIGLSLGAEITSHRELESKPPQGAIRVAENVSNFLEPEIKESAMVERFQGKSHAQVKKSTKVGAPNGPTVGELSLERPERAVSPSKKSLVPDFDSANRGLGSIPRYESEIDPETSGGGKTIDTHKLLDDRSPFSSLEEDAGKFEIHGKYEVLCLKWLNGCEKEAQLATLRSSAGRNTPQFCRKQLRAFEKQSLSPHTVNPETLICQSCSLFSVELPLLQNIWPEMSICIDKPDCGTSLRDLEAKVLEPAEMRAQLNWKGCGLSSIGIVGASEMKNFKYHREHTKESRTDKKSSSKKRELQLEKRAILDLRKGSMKIVNCVRKGWRKCLIWKRNRSPTDNKRKYRPISKFVAETEEFRQNVCHKIGGLLFNQFLFTFRNFRKSFPAKFRRIFRDEMIATVESYQYDPCQTNSQHHSHGQSVTAKKHSSTMATNDIKTAIKEEVISCRFLKGRC